MDATMPDRGLPLSLWGIWWNAILLLRPAFSRLRTFMWFVTAVAGLTVRVELLGVTSIVRALNLRPSLYTKLLDHFHSSGIELDRLWGEGAQLGEKAHLTEALSYRGPLTPHYFSVDPPDLLRAPAARSAHKESSHRSA